MPEPPSPDVLVQSRKGKERQAPQTTDLAEKFIALQRKQAHATKPRERAERTPLSSTSTPRPPARPPSPRRLRAPPLAHPNIIVSQASPSGDTTPDEHEFSRRLKISPSSPRNAHAKADHASPRATGGRLYNPNGDGVRRGAMTSEPDAMSDAASSAYVPRATSAHPSRSHLRSQPTRASGEPPRLFDPRKDNPHQFNVLQRPNGLPNGPTAPSPPVLGRPTPTPKSSGDWVSASSTSSASYAHSTISSSFTLSSTTTDSSTGSALFDNNTPRSEDSAGPSALSNQLKRLYREILSLEARVQSEDRDREMAEDADRGSLPQRVGVLTKGGAVQEAKDADKEAEKERYRRMVQDHKELAELVHRMLSLTLAPMVPQSLKSIPSKYNLVWRLWNHSFHRLLELLRRGAMANSEVALEHLQEFIYYAYTFYTNLVEEQNLSSFRLGWVESLGDIARYRIAVSSMIEMNAAKSGTAPAHAITSAALLHATHLLPTATGTGTGAAAHTPDASALSDKNMSPTPACSPMKNVSPAPSVEPQHEGQHEARAHAMVPGAGVPSVGIAAARLMVLEPERERWRQISREWYLKGLTFTPGMGKLHHHLGLLSSGEQGEKEELRAVYHFIKSMITVHPFETSREAILGMWSGPALARRQAPDASLTELFVHMHGMLFTNIQLDDFKPMLARFEEKLVIEGAEVEERDWIMMAVINVGAILEYGRPNAVLRRASATKDSGAPNASSSPVMTNGAGKVKLMMARKAEAMDVDDDGASPTRPAAAGAQSSSSPALSESPTTPAELPFALKMALQLTFRMLTHTLDRPMRERAPFRRQALNPYISIILTFLATVLQDRKDKTAERVLARAVPWAALARFLTTVPRWIMAREAPREAGPTLLSAGCHPLPEDWCLRGLAWSGRKIYERGFWDRGTNGEEKNLEAEVLDRGEEGEEAMDGIIEDEDEEEDERTHKSRSRSDGSPELTGRWVRIARAALKVGRTVNGFVYTPPAVRDGRGEWRVEGALADKVARWGEEDRQEREEEERRLRGTRWTDDDSMDVDDDEGVVDPMSESSDDDDEGDSEEVKALKDRRRYLQSLLESSQISRSQTTRRRPRGPSMPKSSLRVVPGYTILVVDTNILLSSLPMVASLIESLQWTIVLPLPVIMELDGLAVNHTPLGEAASAATSYIISHLRTHSASLKIQTSKGNYLPNLNVRTEQIDFDGDEASWERNMDDLILRAAIWQSEHWMDRTAFLNVNDDMRDTTGASKVVLLSFDRMLRLKARSREVDAANEHELATILAARP